ncbi:MAG: nucleoside hydrolase [Nocardioides sp.]
MNRALVPALLVALLATGCTAAYDDDGEARGTGRMTPAPAKAADAVPVVVDSDLAPDDLAAITYLVRHPRVRVLGITVPTTGMVTCTNGGLQLLADLFATIEARSVPVACGVTPRSDGAVAFPRDWGAGVASDSGLPHLGLMPYTPSRESAADLIAREAMSTDDLQVVALAPLTELATVRRDHPAAYRRIAGITTMAGIVDAESHDAGQGVGEWNAAADPVAFDAVLAGSVPVTVVPDDPVPDGVPAGMDAPVVGALGVGTTIESPAYWDLATAGLFTLPTAGTTAVYGAWRADVRNDRGRLHRTGDGTVRVVTALDAPALDEAYTAVFAPD